MGIVSKFVKLGIAKKVFDEARKPENQAKIRHGVEQARTYVAQRKQRHR